MSAITLTASRSLWRSRRFSLVSERFATPVGEVERPVIHHPGAVCIIAQPEPGTVLLVRQWRYAVRRWTLEIVAGTREAGEPPAVTAARELQEEAGFSATRLDEVGRFFPALGVSDEEMILYRAHGLSRVAASPDHGELVEPAILRLDELPARCASGEICDAKTLLGLSLCGFHALHHP